MAEAPPDYDYLAAVFLSAARENVARQQPSGELAIFLWRGDWRIGSVQMLGYEEVALISVSSAAMPDGFIEAIRRVQPGMRELTVDPKMDFDDRLHVARVEGAFVGMMTPTQLWWAGRNVPDVSYTNA